MKTFMIKPNQCTGCHLCEMACAYKHHNVFSLEMSNIRIEANEDIAFNVPTKCMQCEKAYCIRSCVAGALIKNEETNAVEVDRSKCIGCKACIMACPFGSIILIKKNKQLQISLCDLCGGDPECVKVCGSRALSYVDPVRMNREKRELVYDRMKEIEDEA